MDAAPDPTLACREWVLHQEAPLLVSLLLPGFLSISYDHLQLQVGASIMARIPSGNLMTLPSFMATKPR